MYKLIDLCHENGVEPVLVTTPFRREYNDRFSDRFYEKFYGDIQNICDRTGCRYLDYSHDERFCDSDRYFYDADHLSEEGGRAFTDFILAEIRGD